MSRRNFKDGKENGLQEFFYENGQLEQKINYKDDQREGVWEDFRLNGQLYSRRMYKEGILQSSEYYDENKKRVIDGIMKAYHFNGRLLMRFNIKDGKRNGIQKWFYGKWSIRK